MGSMVSKNSNTYDTFQENGTIYDKYYIENDTLLDMPKLNNNIPIWTSNFI